MSMFSRVVRVNGVMVVHTSDVIDEVNKKSLAIALQ